MKFLNSFFYYEESDSYDLYIEILKALATCTGTLSLKQIDLDNEVIQILKSCKGKLILGDYFKYDSTKLSIETAKVLSACTGQVYLGSLSTIDSDVARTLVTCIGKLQFPDLIELDLVIANILGTYAGSLELGFVSCPEIKNIDVIAARALACSSSIHLDCLSEIGVEEAKIISASKAFISLKGLTELNIDVARALAHCTISPLALPDDIPELNLDGVAELSEDVAKVLANQIRDLVLGGIKELSHAVAKILVTHKGPVSLLGLQKADPETWALLREHENIVLPKPDSTTA